MTLDRISNVHVLRPKLGDFVAANSLTFRSMQSTNGKAELGRLELRVPQVRVL